ncbi:hypothetical protein T06_3752 [Trichinella sp. T6]|nr:hypothetical protein T06_3752 [Trichinella sp. T6]
MTSLMKWSGVVFNMIDALISPANPNEKSFDEILFVLEEHFSPQRSEIAKRRPPLQNDLVQILMRFRRFRVGLQAGSLEETRIFRFKRVCFGLTCLPFLATSMISYHALNHLQGFPLGANQELENMYVDDIVFYVDEIVDAKETVIQLVAIMKKGGFRLTKLVSDMQAVFAKLPSEDLIKKNTNLVSKSLGIVWDLAKDELTYGSPPNVDVGSSDMKHPLICVIKV